jgi:hypothetical protein
MQLAVCCNAGACGSIQPNWQGGISQGGGNVLWGLLHSWPHRRHHSTGGAALHDPGIGVEGDLELLTQIHMPRMLFRAIEFLKRHDIGRLLLEAFMIINVTNSDRDHDCRVLPTSDGIGRGSGHLDSQDLLTHRLHYLMQAAQRSTFAISQPHQSVGAGGVPGPPGERGNRPQA